LIDNDRQRIELSINVKTKKKTKTNITLLHCTKLFNLYDIITQNMKQNCWSIDQKNTERNKK